MASEYNVEFIEPDFDNIKKVISVWICLSSPKRGTSSIMEYNFCENAVVGNIPLARENFDLMQVVMVYVGHDDSSIEDDLLKLLHLVFRAKIDAAKKKQRLNDEFGIKLDNEMLKEVNIMCNLGEGLVEETWDEAWDKATLTYLKRIVGSLGVSIEQAMDALDIPVESRSYYASMLH